MEEIEAGSTEAFCGLITGTAMGQLLKETEVISRDYVDFAGRSPVQQGFVYYYAGFRLKVSKQLGTDTSTGYRKYLLWHHDAMCVGVWKRRQISVDKLPEHRGSTGITVKINLGATRIHDRGVLVMLHNEA